MKCNCGFQFSGPGEFRNCNVVITTEGKTVAVCPECGTKYLKEQEVNVK